jgi:superfamily II DNA/RNA helicase
MCKDNDKLRLLEDHLAQADDKRVIVFVNTKTHCDLVSRHLDHLGYRCVVLHGGKSQVSTAALFNALFLDQGHVQHDVHHC